jgi:riboflavin biosynthesis pyrimidine reductase
LKDTRLAPEARVNLRHCFNSSEDAFPLPPHIKQFYGPFGFPNPADANRPYICSNLVMGLDGRASFQELKDRAGGKDVSRSKEDRWLMDFLRAHHDAQLIGASTLREEPGPDGHGWDFGIDDEELRVYRQETLKLARQKIIVLSGSGDVDLNCRLFNSPRVEPWIISSAEGTNSLRSQLKKTNRNGAVIFVIVGESRRIDLVAAVRLLRREHGIRTLLCEGGPTLYGELLKNKLVDEDFRTISLQVLGESTNPGIVRPTTYGNVSYTPETAPWFTLISLHYALPHHAFVRLRYKGPRTFHD